MKERDRKNTRMLAALVLVVAGMGGLAYASVPLYQLFCQITGYGGTPKVVSNDTPAAENKSTDVSTQATIKVRFDANAARKLPWRFRALQKEVTVRLGEENLAFYEVTNLSDQPITGRATYNVTPYKAGPYFSKIACFCFDEQTVMPGETVTMPVQYSVDPDILKDVNTREVRTITLSYTFFRIKNPQSDAASRVSLKTGNDTPGYIKEQGATSPDNG